VSHVAAAAVSPLRDICADVRRGHTSARSRVDGFLATIAAKDGEIHAFNEVHADAARARADAIDAMWTARRRTPTIGLSPREQR
jgi:Asp-tRNA(Asn)/Glu-tRNA(Gln) amidotransferase A subunit family amidase